jgi:hypothetical protein
MKKFQHWPDPLTAAGSAGYGNPEFVKDAAALGSTDKRFGWQVIDVSDYPGD